MNQTSNGNIEIAIISARATVMIYDDTMKRWQPSGTSTGLSKVQLLYHQLNNTYRVVGRKLQDHEVVINCSLVKSLKYNQANQTFLQWRDSKQVYGLNFQTKEEAEQFTLAMKQAVDNLNRLNLTNNDQQLSKQRSNDSNNQIYEDTDRFNNTNNTQFINITNNNTNNNTIKNGNNGGSSTGGTSSPSQTSIHSRHSSDYGSGPNLPYQISSSSSTTISNNNHYSHQDINNQNKIYDVIQDSNITNSGLKMATNSSAGAPPPPPPPLPNNLLTTPINAPPPPPLNGLAAALNGMSLNEDNHRVLKPVKKEPVVVEQQQAAKPAPKIDFLTEIRLRFESKKQQLEEQDQNDDIDSCKPPINSNGHRQQQQQQQQIKNQQNSNSTTKLHIDSPKSLKKNSSTTSVNSNGYTTTNGHTTNGNHYAASNGTPILNTNLENSNINYDKLKSELLTEIKKEMQIMKNDIINALLLEIRKTNFN